MSASRGRIDGPLPRLASGKSTSAGAGRPSGGIFAPTAVLLAMVILVAACQDATGPTRSPTGSLGSGPLPSASTTTEPATPAPTALPTAVPTTAPTGPPTPWPTPPDLDGRWTGGVLDPRTPDSLITDVVSLDARVVAVGRWDIDGAGAWVSDDDAMTWQPYQSSTLLGLGIAAATVLDDGIVGVGRELDPERDVAVVVRSVDGRTWIRDPASDAFEGAQMIDVTPFRGGLVAVGSAPGADAAVVWVARDGRTWERVPDGPTLAGAFMWTVGAAGPGIIAGGWRREGDLAAAIWTSVDGITWTVAPAIQEGAGMQIRGVAATATGYVAVGELIDVGRSAAWVSSDGGTWTRIDPPAFEGASVAALLATEFGLVAVGSHNVDDGAVWLSADGTEWTLVEDPDLADAFLTSVTSHRGRLVAGGATQVELGTSGSYDIRAGAWASLP